MSTVVEKFLTFLTSFFSLFPDDPFTEYLESAKDSFVTYAGYINYFIPVRTMYYISFAWATAIVTVRLLFIVYDYIKSKGD